MFKPRFSFLYGLHLVHGLSRAVGLCVCVCVSQCVCTFAIGANTAEKLEGTTRAVGVCVCLFPLFPPLLAIIIITFICPHRCLAHSLFASPH